MLRRQCGEEIPGSNRQAGDAAFPQKRGLVLLQRDGAVALRLCLHLTLENMNLHLVACGFHGELGADIDHLSSRAVDGETMGGLRHVCHGTAFQELRPVRAEKLKLCLPLDDDLRTVLEPDGNETLPEGKDLALAEGFLRGDAVRTGAAGDLRHRSL